MPVMSRRHQVRRELDALERQVQHVCASVLTSSVLASPGTPTSSTCPLAEHGDQHLLDDLLLADDDLAQLGGITLYARESCSTASRSLICSPESFAIENRSEKPACQNHAKCLHLPHL